MPDPTPPPDLPEHLEDEVLGILDGEEGGRDEALAAVLAREPRHAPTLRRWLAAAGVLPGAQGAHPASNHGDTVIGTLEPGGPADEALPLRLGAYVLLEVLGRGGFGTVYRAEQTEPFQRRVAVKVLNPGMDSREVLSRFEAEREALNRMCHPGIATLLDAGRTPGGRPYFVMELVEGPRLAVHCRQRRLPVRARLELFLKVLDAMQHAHQKSVLHRDLSSNNVLLANPDGDAQPKIIDFGIAKSLADPLLQGGAMTFQGTLMGTPEFMSPEQATGTATDLDTRTDVYALGVQLYELLTDTLPIPSVVLRAQGIAGIARIVATHQPSRPSDVAPRAHRALVLGDLDAITLKAIAKDRDERYASVGDLAADLRRHLADEPVTVAQPTTWYRLRKFVRRNRAQSAAFALAFAGITTALVFLVLALQHAEQKAQESERLRHELEQRADAGFRLLANEERLQQAIDAEASLPPPWPEHERRYAEWRRRHQAPLEQERQKIEQRLAQLDARAAAAGGTLADDTDRHLQHALRRLLAQLAAFFGPGGPVELVEQRAAFLRDRLQPALREHRIAFEQARAAIQRSDGEAASRLYRGLRLEGAPGLVPLGADPLSRLWEFLDLASHEPGYPLPPRDPSTGMLQTGAGTGIVFVLLPAGTVAMGARRDPGMDRHDEHAADDELGGEVVPLDEFFVARTEVTVAQWARLTGVEAPAIDPELPATGIDWFEACAALRRYGLSLPTEAQWEYACRATTATPWCHGDDPAVTEQFGWFRDGVHRVGLLRPNAFGLYDLHGNVAEWCADEKLPYHDFQARPSDGLRVRAPTNGAAAAPAFVAVRGGSLHDGPLGSRCTTRRAVPPTARDPTIGLRPIRRRL
jgi:serine/threonine protein kinase/formylglycine-generating enzyme required for sulfatase activity